VPDVDPVDILSLRPRMRAVEAVHYKQQGQDMFLLRDPLHYSESQLHVSPDVFVIASLFDGQHDFKAVRDAFRTRFGAAVSDENIRKVMRAMDEAHFLEGPAFQEWRDGIEDHFRRRAVRDAILAGNCYPEDARDIGPFLDSFFTTEGGPGRPAERRVDAECIRAMIVPHIDLRRGGGAYAHAYKALWESRPPETVVVLGVAHASKGNLLSFTKKPFETPLGRLECDIPLVDRLAGIVGPGAYADEYAHKGEHSVEIQGIWLQHVCGSNAPRIVPILCGSIRECIDDRCSPRFVPDLVPFADELAAVIRESAGRVLVMASVDLAHIGQKFGDEVPLTPRLLRKNGELDLKMLEIVRTGDAEAFFEFVRKELDRRKVCGLTPIYVLLTALESAFGRKASGKLLHYDQSPEEETQSLVSFAAMTLG
jgi:AmmeMemoRadiSam system protein B